MTLCSDCHKPLCVNPKRKGTRCQPCASRASARQMNSDPEMKARQLAGIRAKMADPVKRAKHIELATANVRKWQQSEEGRARLIEIGRELHLHSRRPDVRERWLAGRKASGEKRSATVLSWCPPDRLEEYRFLTRSKRLTPDEARTIIEADMAEEGIREVRRNAEAMRRKHERDLAQRY